MDFDEVTGRFSSSLNDQQMVDRFVLLAKPRLLELLHLRIPHIYDDRPGHANSTFAAPNGSVALKLTSTRQRYTDIKRFGAEDKEMGFVVNPALVPLVKTILPEVRGRQLLVTRKVALSAGDTGAIAHMEGFGVRVRMYHDEDGKESHVLWECLFGVL
jgi:hypothetical protein